MPGNTRFTIFVIGLIILSAGYGGFFDASGASDASANSPETRS